MRKSSCARTRLVVVAMVCLRCIPKFALRPEAVHKLRARPVLPPYGLNPHWSLKPILHKRVKGFEILGFGPLSWHLLPVPQGTASENSRLNLVRSECVRPRGRAPLSPRSRKLPPHVLRMALALDAISVRPDASAIDLTAAVDHARSRTTTASRCRPRPASTASFGASRVRAHERAPTGWCSRSPTIPTTSSHRLIVAPRITAHECRRVCCGPISTSACRASPPSKPPRSAIGPSARDSAPIADVFRVTTRSRRRRHLRDARCAPTACRSSICGNPTPTRTRSIRSRSTQGIVIGISSLLALVLTILFVVKGTHPSMFPAAAALAWAVLVYIGVDFGFWGKVFDMSAGAGRVWRASGEAILAATIAWSSVFAYLNLNRWHVRYVPTSPSAGLMLPRIAGGAGAVRPGPRLRHRCASRWRRSRWSASA